MSAASECNERCGVLALFNNTRLLSHHIEFTLHAHSLENDIYFAVALGASGAGNTALCNMSSCFAKKKHFCSVVCYPKINIIGVKITEKLCSENYSVLPNIHKSLKLYTPIRLETYKLIVNHYLLKHHDSEFEALGYRRLEMVQRCPGIALSPSYQDSALAAWQPSGCACVGVA